MRSLGCSALLVALASAAPLAAAWPPPVPDTLILTVREISGVARTGEIVTSGIPLPRSLGLLDPTALTLVDAASQPVPAEFRVLARWNVGRNQTTAPVQWLLVSFPATVPAGRTATYRIVTDGSAGPNPPPAAPLSLTVSGNQVTVDTGAATFILGGNPDELFDEIRLAQGTPLVTGGGGRTFHLLGDRNNQVNWGAPNTPPMPSGTGRRRARTDESRARGTMISPLGGMLS